MTKEPDYPYDLYIFRRYDDVPAEDRWKWGWEIWNPLIDQIFQGNVKVNDLSCPICSQKTVYACFLIGNLKYAPKRKNEEIYVGDIFIGCHFCQIQKRHVGEAPTWADEKDIVWVSEKAERIAKIN